MRQWEREWQMEFHPGKCKVIHISRSSPINPGSYYLHKQMLESVPSAKYLGITITNNLNRNNHISNICKSANSILGFLRTNIWISSPEVKTLAYNAFVQPKVECASSLWDPHTANKIRQIEGLQRRAARWVVIVVVDHSYLHHPTC